MEENTNIKPKSSHTIMTFGRTETGTPIVSEYFGNQKWISFGVHNDFPQEIIRIYQNSFPLHSALIDRKVEMVSGSGFTTATPFIQNIYSQDDLNTIAKKCAYDKVLFGGFYLNVIWSRDGQTIATVEHLPYEKMRVAKYDSDQIKNINQLPGFYFSKDWLKHRRKENEPKFIPTFDPDFKSEYPSQVMFFKTYSPGLDYYTLPSYNSALNDLKLGYEISTYHVKNVQNGMNPSMVIVNKSGQPTFEEREIINQEMKRTFSGSDNAGSFIMVYADTPETAPDFTPIQPNATDQRFKDLSDRLDTTIMQVHKFTSAIAGIETSGKLGAAQEIEEQLQYIQNTVITPIQNDIENAFMKIAKINKNNEILELVQYSIFNNDQLEADEAADPDSKDSELQSRKS